jgi:hypothetical protein
MSITTHLSCTATFTSWAEEPRWDSGAPTPRLAHATVVFEYRGDLEATSTCQSVLYYADGTTGVTVGLERVAGWLRGEDASVVLQHAGTFGPDGVEIHWSVVPGSGAGALAGFWGAGGYAAAAHTKEWTWHLDGEG